MAFDDPIVWVLILGVVVFMFGSSKIPQFARSLGQARKEFEEGAKGLTTPLTTLQNAAPVAPQAPIVAPAVVSQQVDPIVLAAESEGIDTRGKSKAQIAEELSFKLSKK